MSLFKNDIVKNFNILVYEDDMLLLHCARNEAVKSPIKGKLIKTEDGCEITGSGFTLKLSNVNIDENVNANVNAGAVIGMPVVRVMNGREIACVGVAIYKNKKMVDIINYLKRLDVEEVKKPEPKKEKEKVITDDNPE